MPCFIETLIRSELEDMDGSAFVNGYEEGAEEKEQEWLNKDIDEVFPLQKIEFAIEVLNRLKSESVENILRELEFEKCRYL